MRIRRQIRSEQNGGKLEYKDHGNYKRNTQSHPDRTWRKNWEYLKIIPFSSRWAFLVNPRNFGFPLACFGLPHGDEKVEANLACRCNGCNRSRWWILSMCFHMKPESEWGRNSFWLQRCVGPRWALSLRWSKPVAPAVVSRIFLSSLIHVRPDVCAQQMPR